MEYLIKATFKIQNPTTDQLRAIRARIHNLLLDFSDEQDIDVVVDFSPTEVM
jgi:SAM-dependent MidA family methyltransferase